MIIWRLKIIRMYINQTPCSSLVFFYLQAFSISMYFDTLNFLSVSVYQSVLLSISFSLSKLNVSLILFLKFLFQLLQICLRIQSFLAIACITFTVQFAFGINQVNSYLEREWYSCEQEWAFCLYDDPIEPLRRLFEILTNNHIGNLYFCSIVQHSYVFKQ